MSEVITREGIKNLITLAIDKYDRQEIEPLRTKVDKLEHQDILTKEFIKKIDKLFTEWKWLLRAIALMIIGLVGDMVWYWIKVSVFHAK